MRKPPTTPLQTTDPVDLLVEITTADPIALPLLASGVLVLGFTVGFVGVLAAGALLETLGRPFE